MLLNKIKSYEGIQTQTQYKHTTGLKHKPRPRRSIVGPPGQVSSQEGQNNHPWRDEVKSQPRHKDHPAYRKSKGSVATESEEDRVKATYVYRWMPQEQAVLTTSQA